MPKMPSASTTSHPSSKATLPASEDDTNHGDSMASASHNDDSTQLLLIPQPLKSRLKNDRELADFVAAVSSQIEALSNEKNELESKLAVTSKELSKHRSHALSLMFDLTDVTEEKQRLQESLDTSLQNALAFRGKLEVFEEQQAALANKNSDVGGGRQRSLSNDESSSILAALKPPGGGGTRSLSTTINAKPRRTSVSPSPGPASSSAVAAALASKTNQHGLLLPPLDQSAPKHLLKQRINLLESKIGSFVSQERAWKRDKADFERTIRRLEAAVSKNQQETAAWANLEIQNQLLLRMIKDTANGSAPQQRLGNHNSNSPSASDKKNQSRIAALELQIATAQKESQQEVILLRKQLQAAIKDKEDAERERDTSATLATTKDKHANRIQEELTAAQLEVQSLRKVAAIAPKERTARSGSTTSVGSMPPTGNKSRIATLEDTVAKQSKMVDALLEAIQKSQVQKVTPPASRKSSAPASRKSSADHKSSAPASRKSSADHKASAPASRKSSAPASRKSSAPASRKSSAPASRKSSAPASRKSSAPASRKSSAPASRKSSAPAHAKSSRPTSAVDNIGEGNSGDRRRTEAATRIQSQVRGARDRRRSAALATERSDRASKDEDAQEKEAAAVKIQAQFRGARVRKQTNSLVVDQQKSGARNGEKTEETNVRASSATSQKSMTEEQQHEQEMAAVAVKIQSKFRGAQVRKQRKSVTEETGGNKNKDIGDGKETVRPPCTVTSQKSMTQEQREQEQAAIRIQARVRGTQARSRGRSSNTNDKDDVNAVDSSEPQEAAHSKNVTNEPTKPADKVDNKNTAASKKKVAHRSDNDNDNNKVGRDNQDSNTTKTEEERQQPEVADMEVGDEL